MRSEINHADNVIRVVINVLQRPECKIKCKGDVIKLLEAAIMELDTELESLPLDANS